MQWIFKQTERHLPSGFRARSTPHVFRHHCKNSFQSSLVVRASNQSGLAAGAREEAKDDLYQACTRNSSWRNIPPYRG